MLVSGNEGQVRHDMRNMQVMCANTLSESNVSHICINIYTYCYFFHQNEKTTVSAGPSPPGAPNPPPPQHN